MSVKRDVATASKPPLTLPKCTLTATSLTFDESATEKDLREAMGRLASVAGASQWWIGDGLNHGAAQYGDIAQVAADLGKHYQTAATAKQVAGMFTPKRRRLGLPFSFHEAVRALPEKEQDELLDWAETPGEDGELPTRKQLRDKVRGRKASVWRVA